MLPLTQHPVLLFICLWNGEGRGRDLHPIFLYFFSHYFRVLIWTEHFPFGSIPETNKRWCNAMRRWDKKSIRTRERESERAKRNEPKWLRATEENGIGRIAWQEQQKITIEAEPRMDPTNISISLFAELFHAFRYGRINDGVFHCTPRNSRAFFSPIGERMLVSYVCVRCTLTLLQNIIKTGSYLKHVPNHLATKTILLIYKFDRPREWKSTHTHTQ